jgi:hypothetical protein
MGQLHVTSQWQQAAMEFFNKAQPSHTLELPTRLA